MDPDELSFLRAMDEVDPVLGIDVKTYRKDVLRYILAHFRGRLRVAGIDVEDAVAEALLGLVIRNAGTCPWRPGGKSRASYVYMVTEGVVNNMVRHRLYRTRNEIHTLDSRHMTHVNMGALDAEGVGAVVPLKREDVHAYLVTQVPARTQMDNVLLDDMDREFADEPHVRTWVHCTVSGMTRQDIQRSCILNSHQVTAAQRAVRRFLRE